MSSAYRLMGRIEAGELAEQYEALQEPTGSRVVVKLFLPKTSDPRYATVLAQTYSVLNPLHPEGIVSVLDMGFVQKRLAVVREYVGGYTLGTALQRLNSKEVLLPVPVALYLVIQLLEAVERAHAVGIVHGAITPGNVQISRAGKPAVFDFGALQALMAVPELKRAFAGRGRSAYRAPEVGRGDMPDVQSDIYSIGALAYELLTLHEAVIPDGGVSTRRAGLPPLSRLDRRIHARLDPIVLRALDATPSRRFRSCAEFAGALRNFLANDGGVPGAEDLRRFVAELYPNEVTVVAAAGAVPFSERFTLTPISGVSLAQVSADALDKSVVVRPSFSPALSESDTMEAPPAFEEYRPESFVPPDSVVDRNVLESTHVFAGKPPQQEDGSEPTHVRTQALTEVEMALQAPPGDDEQTWVAPPGAAPPKPRRPPIQVGGAAAAAREGTRIGKNPRLRVMEDFSRPSESGAPPPAGDPDDLVDTAKIEGTVSRSKVSEGTVTRARIPPEGTVSRSKVSEGTVTRARIPPSLVRGPASEQPPPAEKDLSDYIPMPPPTSPEMKAAGSQRRLFTEERNLMADARRRRRMMGVAAAIFLVGLVCFALGVWRFLRKPLPDTDPNVSAVSGAVEQYLQQTPEPAPKPKPRPAPPPQPQSEAVSASGVTDDTPREGVAYLSLDSNRPARAYIDGVRVKRNLPLVRYPVKSGTREIIVETLGLPRQREVFPVRLERGEHKKLEQLFPDTPHR